MIQKPKDFENVEPEQEFQRPVPAAYICHILDVQQTKSKKNDRPMLRVELDIVEGPFAHFFKHDYEHKVKLGWYDINWALSHFLHIDFDNQSTDKLGFKLGDTAQSKFKSFLIAIEESNPNFKFDWDKEHCLVGKRIGALVCIQERENSSGDIRPYYRVERIYPVQKVLDGKTKPPWITGIDGKKRPADQLQPPKPAPKINSDTGLEEVDEVDIPF